MNEPRVVTADVRALLLAAIRPDDPDYGEAVQMVADKAQTSTRTVYRILGETYAPSMGLSLADRLALASGGHLIHCRLVMEDGRVLDYDY